VNSIIAGMERYFKSLVLISLAIVIIGLVIRIEHWPGAQITRLVAYAISLIYIFWALRDIYSSHKTRIVKILWTLGFILVPWITGLVYYYKEIRPKYLIK
jgi:uncharacterized membrane protein YqjE